MAKIAVGVWAIFGLMTTILAQPISGQNDQYQQAPAISIRASIWGGRLITRVSTHSTVLPTFLN